MIPKLLWGSRNSDGKKVEEGEEWREREGAFLTLSSCRRSVRPRPSVRRKVHGSFVALATRTKGQSIKDVRTDVGQAQQDKGREDSLIPNRKLVLNRRRGQRGKLLRT